MEPKEEAVTIPTVVIALDGLFHYEYRFRDEVLEARNLPSSYDENPEWEEISTQDPDKQDGITPMSFGPEGLRALADLLEKARRLGVAQ